MAEIRYEALPVEPEQPAPAPQSSDAPEPRKKFARRQPRTRSVVRFGPVVEDGLRP
jgi:hypothetical protein